jgi:hypothetical protein
MIRFPWIRRYAPRVSRSPFDGGTSQYADELRELIAEYRTESLRWDGDPGDDLWDDAWQLEAVRNALLRGTMTADDAGNWIVAGQLVLDGYRTERSRTNHPAGKLR